MELQVAEMLKKDLVKAIREKNITKIEEICRILHISEDQKEYFGKGLTGFPSIDKVWLDKYAPGAEERANNIPLDKTVWDIIEQKLLEYYDIPAMEYFGKIFSREEFRELCYKWARTFRAMGVEENEIVPVYGPFVPDVCAMVFALNMIGACPYFLKLAITPEALAEETKEAKVAVVYDGMWDNVAEEFIKDKFRAVIIASVPEDMPSPKKQIVSFINKIQARKNKYKIPEEKKYIWADKAKEIADYYTGEVKTGFTPNKNAFITSSSGTTIGGTVKGTVATNESTISQLYMATASDTQFFAGDRILNHFPPTASTSLNLLFLMALYSGETILLDPRVSPKDWYNQLINLKPNQALHTSSAWEEFFNRVEWEMTQGKKFDFRYARGWTIGGEGTDVKKYKRWNRIMNMAGAEEEMISGYGQSELFSAVSAEKVDARYDCSKTIMSVGLPYAGMTIGIFDQDGNELPYNHRGELRIKSKSAMKCYYNKPELTDKVLVDGWIHTGDMASIDEKGFLYIYGRLTDSIKDNDETIYLFDIANAIKQNDFISDAIVINKATEENPNTLVAHIVWAENVAEEEKKTYINQLNNQLRALLPANIHISGYKTHEKMLPYSATTLKKDKNKMHSENKGYIQVINNEEYDIEFVINENNKYELKYTKKEKERTRKRKK